jgi:hypothetical protein
MAAVIDAKLLLVSKCSNFTIAPYDPWLALSRTSTISQSEITVSTDFVSNMCIIFISLYANDQKHCDSFITFHFIQSILPFTEIYLSLTGSLCEAEIIPPKQTVGLISLVREPYGRCTNTHQIHGFTKCSGKCYSQTVYNSGKFTHKFLNVLLYRQTPIYCHCVFITVCGVYRVWR